MKISCWQRHLNIYFFKKVDVYNRGNSIMKRGNICGALGDLVPFAQFKKRQKHPWRSVNFKLYKWYQTAQRTSIQYRFDSPQAKRDLISCKLCTRVDSRVVRLSNHVCLENRKYQENLKAGCTQIPVLGIPSRNKMAIH